MKEISPKPRPHQSEAIAACVRGLKKPSSRGQCIMACGTGKTLVGYEVAAGTNARRVLTLVPSLLLVNQLVREYRRRGAQHILSVCSDESAGGEDAIQISVKELEADNTTDAKVARAFLSGAGQRIVVCTYQSLRNLAEVFDGLSFDLAIFDEAHKTAGGKSKLFAHALTDNGLKLSRRLFMTATPRHAKLREDGSEAQVYAMNDPKVYGPVLYSLPLRKAIEAGIIDDYRIVVAVVSQPKTEDLRDQAIRVAIDHAAEKFGIRKIFTFHARVSDASDFILGATDTLKGMRLYHVSGQQSSAERGLKLDGFRNSAAALMSNARCLTEGVDLPAADMAAFLAPKRNPIDIVQAVGRVLRKHESKTKGGFVFLPVFVRDGQDEEAAIAESDWRGVYEVLQAMREQDEPLSVALRESARGGDGVTVPEKVTVMSLLRAHPDVRGMTESMRRSIVAKVLRPFVADPDGRKAELLALARIGAKRPTETSNMALAKALWHYTNPKRNSTHAGFEREIRSVAPHWFTWKPSETTAAEKKAELLRMARAGDKRPRSEAEDPQEAILGRALCTYTSPSSPSRDARFDRELRSIAPGWFGMANDVAEGKKRELMELARSGAPRPKQSGKDRERSLAFALRRFASAKSESFDSVFFDAIRSIARHWFERPVRAADVKEPRISAASVRVASTKAHLLNMARSGDARPNRLAQDENERSLGKRLCAYLCKSNPSYDDEFRRSIIGVAPGWIGKTPSASENKATLLRMIKEGKTVPPRGTVLGNAFKNYTKKSSKVYDHAFVDEIERLSPTLMARRRARGGCAE